jgi:capsular exopolysaccharide synthesis family protein
MAVPPYPPPASPLPAPPALDYYGEHPDHRGLRDYLHILMKRKWWVIGTFLTVFILAALYTFLRTPIWRTTATLQITQDNPGSLVSVDDKLSKLTGSDSLEKFQQTQYKIIQSRSLALRVIQALNLKEHEDFRKIWEDNPDLTQTQIQEAMIEAFQKKLEVTPVRNSFLVEVAFQSPDKVMAERVVNAIADEYMYLSIDRRNESFSLVRKWLDKQLHEMASKVQEAQNKLYKFGQEKDIYSLEDKDNVIVQKFIDLSALLTKAQAEKMAKEAQYQQIKDKGPDAPLIVNHPLVASLRQQLVAQQAKVSALSKVFRGEHPEIMGERANILELQARLKAEVQRLQESVKADYEAASRTESLLSDSFAAQKGQMAKLQDNLSEFQILKRDAQTSEQLYQALLARVKEANIAGTMVPSNIAIIDPAQQPNRPFQPRKMRDLALAMIIGLTLGVGLAFLLEHLDDSIKSLYDLEKACSLPSLGMVPRLGGNGSMGLPGGQKTQISGIRGYLPRLQRDGKVEVEAADLDLIVYKEPKSLISEAIGHVYSAIMLSASGRPPCAVMVTSPNPSEGKTSLVSNLAQSFALNGRQVVLIDCDLRKPRIHNIFDMDLQPGLSNYLSGSASLEEILKTSEIPNLTIITGGTRPPSPTNLLNSEAFKDLLTQLRERFSHIIIDTPPVLGFADARFVSMQVDGVLLVTRYNFTHRSAGRMAHQLLSQAPMLGVVLNAVGPYSQTYGSYYYYQYQSYSKYYGDIAK